MSREVDPAQKAAMIAMAKAGHTGHQISAAFGYANKKSAGLALRRWGVTLAENEKARNDAKRAEIVRLFQSGKSRKEIWRAGAADIKTIRAVVADIPPPVVTIAPAARVKIRAVPKVLPPSAPQKPTAAKVTLGFSQDAIDRYLVNERRKTLANGAAR